MDTVWLIFCRWKSLKSSEAKVTKLPEHLYPRIQVICTCWAVQRCIFFFFFPLYTSSQFGQWVAEQMDGRCVPFPRLEWLLLHQSAQMPFNVVCRHGEEPRGDKGNACNTQFPQGTRTQHAHTHMHTLLCCAPKGFPLCGRWINEGVEGWTIELHNGRLGRAAALWGLLPLRPGAAMENTWPQSITLTLFSLSRGQTREKGAGAG